MALISVLATVLSRLIGEEIMAWSPWITHTLIKLAVMCLPEKRARFEEEWQSHINEVPGTVGKFLGAAGFLLAASKIRLTVRGVHRVETWLQTVAQLQQSHSKSMAMLDSIRHHTGVNLLDEHLKPFVDELSGRLNEAEELRSQIHNDLTALIPVFERSFPVVLAAELVNRRKFKKIGRGFDRMSAQAERINEASEKVMNLLTRIKEKRISDASDKIMNLLTRIKES